MAYEIGCYSPELVVPMKRPLYTFLHEPSTDELRQMAVKAMRDQLAIFWYPEKDLEYITRPGIWVATSKDKVFRYNQGTGYHGIPYDRGNTALAQWYEFYDVETGALRFPGDGTALRDLLGNSCSSCVMWAWIAVCDSMQGSFGQRFMVPRNGAYPVGPYTFDPEIESYLVYSTQKIIEDNGQDVIFQSYAQVLPGDALNTQPNNHVMMAIAPAHVEYASDGKIDPEKSYITIQDQRGGNSKTESKFYETEIGGQIHRFSGRLSFDISFERLLRDYYIPLTTAELSGRKAYQSAKVEFVGSLNSLEDLLSGFITSNYPICVAKLMKQDTEGKEVLLDRKILNGNDVGSGIARKYPMDSYAQILRREMIPGVSSTFRLEVVLSTGETFTPVQYQT